MSGARGRRDAAVRCPELRADGRRCRGYVAAGLTTCAAHDQSLMASRRTPRRYGETAEQADQRRDFYRLSQRVRIRAAIDRAEKRLARLRAELERWTDD